MAYVFDLEGSVPDTPFVDALGTEICEFALGYDLDEETAEIMSVMLVPGGSYLDDEVEGVYDLRFGIRTRDLTAEWRVTAPDYTKERVDQCIPKIARSQVYQRLLEAIEVLINNNDTDSITMETFYSNLDERSLEKYTGICNFICEYGFELKDAFRDGTNGKNYWFLSRTD